jgi:predicted TIM-barrel fold metal-dependent hydrolase
VDAALDRAVAGGMRALKNAYAYFGSLQLPPPDDEAADRYVRSGDLQDYRSFEAAVLRHLLEWCNKRGMPYQMHAGVSRIPWCNVENLVGQIATYPEVKFVVLHVYPYVGEAGCLARMHHNVYLDPCWLSILAPETLRNALREWIGLVPPERMLFGVDATTPEGWYGGAITAKEVLAEVLEEKVSSGFLRDGEAIEFARQILRDTAHQWYG